MLGGTNTPSGERFDRGAIITVLSKSGHRIYMDHWMPTTELERREGARPPACSAASTACCVAPHRLHLFPAMEPLVPAALRICLLHTSVRCHVNKQLSECSHVTGMRAGALYQ